MSKVFFHSAAEMLQTIQNNTDLYNINMGIYVFLYNECGSICWYNIDLENALDLFEKTDGSDEYWGGYLGLGGYILDTVEWYSENGISPAVYDTLPIDLCKEIYGKDGWYHTSDEDLKTVLKCAIQGGRHEQHY